MHTLFSSIIASMIYVQRQSDDKILKKPQDASETNRRQADYPLLSLLAPLILSSFTLIVSSFQRIVPAAIYTHRKCAASES